MKYTAVTVAALASAAFAQNLAGLPTCAQTAAVTAFASTGCPITDIKCICSNTAFINGVAEAIKTTCSAADQAATIAFAQSFCAQAGVTLPATTLGSGSSTQVSSAAESSAPATTEETSAAATTSAEETSAPVTTTAEETTVETTAAPTTVAVTSAPASNATVTYVPVPVPGGNGTASGTAVPLPTVSGSGVVSGTTLPSPTQVSGAIANAGSIVLSIVLAGFAVLAL